MGAKNKVISGDYKGYNISTSFGSIVFSNILKTSIKVSKSNVKDYELVTEESRKSCSSAILRGAVGASLLGPVGLLAGISAKNKNTNIVAIVFKNGKSSLLEINDKIFKTLLKQLF